MHTRSFEKLDYQLRPGHIYRRDSLAAYSNAIDRDLLRLLHEGLLEKIAAGLYYKPQTSRYGHLPPEDKLLVEAFLRDDQFLLFSWNEYNALGVGLTQLYNRVVVYNRKRHGVFKLGDKEYDFRRPTRGFPKKLTPAFLLVDLLNNLNELSEDAENVKTRVKQHIAPALLKKASQCAANYGKIATKKFFAELKS